MWNCVFSLLSFVCMFSHESILEIHDWNLNVCCIFYHFNRQHLTQTTLSFVSANRQFDSFLSRFFSQFHCSWPVPCIFKNSVWEDLSTIICQVIMQSLQLIQLIFTSGKIFENKVLDKKYSETRFVRTRLSTYTRL